MKRVIVTGGAGFIGSNLVRRLQACHPTCHIVVIDDLRGGHFSNLIEPRPGDEESFRGRFIARAVGDLDWAQLIDEVRPEAVFHLASITDTTVHDQALMMRDNVEAFEKILNACCQAGVKLVWASSAATYGTDANGATSERRPFKLADAGRPANVYGFSKWVMENLHQQAVADNPNLHLVGLRYFNVFGPGEAFKGKMASMICQLSRQAMAGRPPRIFTDGTQARDQVAVADVVDATLAAAADDAQSGIYNVGSGQVTSFNEIVDLTNEALGTNYQPDYFENPYDFYQDYTCADLSQTEAGLSWRPQHEPGPAIIQYIRWLRDLQNSTAPKEPALAGESS